MIGTTNLIRIARISIQEVIDGNKNNVVLYGVEPIILIPFIRNIPNMITCETIGKIGRTKEFTIIYSYGSKKFILSCNGQYNGLKFTEIVNN